MNSIIIYSTMTKHSKKIAKAISDELSIPAYDVKYESTELKNIDMLYIVSGIYSGQITPQLDDYLRNIDDKEISKAAIIMSSVSQEYDKCEIKNILNEKEIEIAGEHSCYGSFLFMKFKHPNKDEIRDAVQFSKDIYNRFNL